MNKDKKIKKILNSSKVLRLHLNKNSINVFYKEESYDAFPIKIAIAKFNGNSSLIAVLGEKVITAGFTFIDTNIFIDYSKRFSLENIYINNNNTHIILDEQTNSSIEIDIYFANNAYSNLLSVNYNILSNSTNMEYITHKRQLCEILISHKIDKYFPNIYSELVVNEDV